MTGSTEREFTNGYDDSTTVMRSLIRPTYRDILALPDHTEILCMWQDGSVDGYDVEQEFKDHMREGMREHHQSLDSFSGVLVIAAVTPDKMNPAIRAALEVM